MANRIEKEVNSVMDFDLAKNSFHNHGVNDEGSFFTKQENQPQATRDGKIVGSPVSIKTFTYFHPPICNASLKDKRVCKLQQAYSRRSKSPAIPCQFELHEPARD